MPPPLRSESGWPILESGGTLRNAQKRQASMPILESKVDQSAIQRNLLAGSWGTVVGLFFGVPPALAAHTMGLPWVPYDVGVITAGLIVGLLIAFTVDALFPRVQTSTHGPQKSRSSSGEARSLASNIRRRLAEEKATLDRLDAQRVRQPGSGFDKTTEDRIVWGELLDLEIQDLDEQVSRICSQSSIESENKGGSHERHNQ
jgi:hypothetical protein